MALDNFRKTSMRIDKANQRFLDYQNAKVGDVNGRELLVQITNNGVVEDQTGTTLKLNWQHENGNQDSTNFKVVDIKTGKYSLYYPKEMLYKGSVDASVEINSNGQITHTMNFKIIVHADVFDGEAGTVDGVFISLADVNKKLDDREKEYVELRNRQSSVENQFDDIKQEMLDKDVISAPEIIEARSGYNTLDERLDKEYQEVSTQLAQTSDEVNKRFLKPYFVEFFASFNRYGIGTPSGISNYEGGNYVLEVAGKAGDSFLTVLSGDINDAVGKWACVIKNDDGIFDTNKVLGTDGVNKLNLLSPLKRNISDGLLGNLHDTNLGQHYTELGYYAFAQHIYNEKPRYAERKEVIAQFLEDDTDGKWNINGLPTYNLSSSMMTVDSTYKNIGGKALVVYVTDGTKFAEWQENLNGYKGYLEAFIGANVGNVKVEFYLDGVLMETKASSKEVERFVFPFEYAKTGKIKIIGAGPYPQSLQIGRVSWYVNDKFSKERLIEPNMKVAYIGDSWGEYHNKATTRELSRLMTADGGTPTVMDFSKSGHTSTYGLVWFDRHIVANKPDVVIIEFFTNDFNSISGIDVGNFTTPAGTQQDMNISSLIQYESNIRKMVDKALENGIQPIVVMPASTNSESQVLSFASKGNDLWNGNKITNDKPFFQEATITKVQSSLYEANGETNVVIKGKAINSSVRKGVIVDSDRNLTGGSIQRWSNNGVDKAGILFDGTADVKGVKLSPQQYSIAMNENSRALLYVMNSAATNGDDELRVVLKLADGSYVMKKIQLTD